MFVLNSQRYCKNFIDRHRHLGDEKESQALLMHETSHLQCIFVSMQCNLCSYGKAGNCFLAVSLPEN